MWVEEIIRCILTAIVSALLLWKGDHFYPIFHRGKSKYEVAKEIPQIFTGKYVEVIGTNTGSAVFAMRVMDDVKTLDGKEELSLYPKFNPTELSSIDDSDCGYGFRINNNTKKGLTLKEIHTTSGNELDLTKTSWTYRFIDPDSTLVLRYEARDCPKSIIAEYGEYLFAYKMDLNSGYIDAKRVKRKKRKSK